MTSGEPTRQPTDSCEAPPDDGDSGQPANCTMRSAHLERWFRLIDLAGLVRNDPPGDCLRASIGRPTIGADYDVSAVTDMAPSRRWSHHAVENVTADFSQSVSLEERPRIAPAERSRCPGTLSQPG